MEISPEYLQSLIMEQLKAMGVSSSTENLTRNLNPTLSDAVIGSQTITLTADATVLKNADNVMTELSNISITSAAVNTRLDTSWGVASTDFQDNTFYFYYLIYNPDLASYDVIFSLDGDMPMLPDGYQSWVKLGVDFYCADTTRFVGTYARGPIGPQGPEGPTGDQGPKGETGVQGDSLGIMGITRNLKIDMVSGSSNTKIKITFDECIVQGDNTNLTNKIGTWATDTSWRNFATNANGITQAWTNGGVEDIAYAPLTLEVGKSYALKYYFRRASGVNPIIYTSSDKTTANGSIGSGGAMRIAQVDQGVQTLTTIIFTAGVNDQYLCIKYLSSDAASECSFYPKITENQSVQPYNVSCGGGIALDILVSGLNGRDAGTTFSPGMWYYVYVVYNPTTKQVGGVFSNGATTPSLPTGFTHYARISVAYYVSPALMPYSQRGNLIIFAAGVSASQPNKIGTFTINAWTLLAEAILKPPIGRSMSVTLGTNAPPVGLYTSSGAYLVSRFYSAGAAEDYATHYATGRYNWQTFQVPWNDGDTLGYYVANANSSLFINTLEL